MRLDRLDLGARYSVDLYRKLAKVRELDGETICEDMVGFTTDHDFADACLFGDGEDEFYDYNLNRLIDLLQETPNTTVFWCLGSQDEDDHTRCTWRKGLLFMMVGRGATADEAEEEMLERLHRRVLDEGVDRDDSLGYWTFVDYDPLKGDECPGCVDHRHHLDESTEGSTIGGGEFPCWPYGDDYKSCERCEEEEGGGWCKELGGYCSLRSLYRSQDCEMGGPEDCPLEECYGEIVEDEDEDEDEGESYCDNCGSQGECDGEHCLLATNPIG